MSTSAAPGLHRRRSSVSQAVDDVKSPSTGASEENSKHAVKEKANGLFKDLYTMRWMTSPASSAKIALVFITGYFSWRLVSPATPNPFEPFLFISHRVPLTQVALNEPAAALRGDTIRYQKGWLDVCFLLFYIVVWSCVRQTTTLHLFKPFAAKWGITSETKQMRFMEQGYSFLYWGMAGAMGLYVMKRQESWWFQLEHLWIKYPFWIMRPELKLYYLLQFSYWLQQALVMLLRLEKPRKDYYELVAHHLVTLWLIFWSYLINMTMIGTTVFVCMDIPDTSLALAKLLNYLGLERITTVSFATFMAVWTYFRIYLSAKTLISVWYEFDLIPTHTREWNPEKGWWLAPWMKYQIFTPLFLLLLLNIFWYFLAWRVLIRSLKGKLEDEREDGEGEEDQKAVTDGKEKGQ